MTFDRTAHLCLALAEPDDLLRMGLQRYLRQYTQWPVVLETSDFVALADLLAQRQGMGELPDLLVLGGGDASAPRIVVEPWLRSLKQQFPALPILLLADVADPIVPVAWWAGIEGACLRSVEATELLEVIWAVASGATAWAPALQAAALGQLGPPLAVAERSAKAPAWMQIDRALQAIDQQLRSPQSNLVERWVLQGRQRELRASRWITQRLLPGVPPLASLPPLSTNRGAGIGQIQTTARVGGVPLANLGDRFAAKLRYPLTNRTEIPLEIDILRPEKQRELLYVVLRQFEAIVDELRFSQVPLAPLAESQRRVLIDLWQAVLAEFFGKYYQVVVQGTEVRVVDSLRQQQGRVETGILSRIPLVAELLGYLLWQSPLTVDNQQFPASSPVAIAQAEAILENLVIQIANAAIGPLLNQFADVEPIKQAFYDRQRLSTRAIERFRNDLSWRDRRDRYVGDPLAMFESQYPLFVLTAVGIDRRLIYAPRRQELEALNGIPLAVTLLWEVRDAVAPRLRTATAWVGTGLVYVLTEVIGRGLGLVGRGILKGIGHAFQDRA